MKTQVHIYYHSDVDGIFSAILYGKLLTDFGGGNIGFTFSSVNYHLAESWQGIDLRSSHARKTIVIVDFLFNPTCDVWYDHHQSGLGAYELSQVKAQGAYDPNAPSACHVIYSQPNRSSFRDEGLIEKIVKEVDMVDYALYPSIETVYDGMSFGPVIRMALLEQSNDEFTNELIRMCIFDGTSLYKLIEGQMPWSVMWRYYRYKTKLEEGYEAFKKVVKVEGSVVHYVTPPYVKCDRYFGFRYKPDADFVAYIQDFSWRGEGYHIGVSKNPWKAKKQINLKQLAEKYGGGGHEDVAGITLPKGSDPNIILRDVIETLKQA